MGCKQVEDRPKRVKSALNQVFAISCSTLYTQSAQSTLKGFYAMVLAYPYRVAMKIHSESTCIGCTPWCIDYSSRVTISIFLSKTSRMFGFSLRFTITRKQYGMYCAADGVADSVVLDVLLWKGLARVPEKRCGKMSWGRTMYV